MAPGSTAALSPSRRRRGGDAAGSASPWREQVMAMADAMCEDPEAAGVALLALEDRAVTPEATPQKAKYAKHGASKVPRAAPSIEELRDVESFFRQEALKAGLALSPETRARSSTSGSPEADSALKTGQAYNHLVTNIGEEEKKRQKLAEQLGDLKKDLGPLIKAKKVPRRRDALDKFLEGQEYWGKVKGSSVSSSSKNPGKSPSGGGRQSQAADGGEQEEEDNKPRLRPCACGCGALVRYGNPEDGDMTALCAEKSALNNLQSGPEIKPQIDGKAQRAAIDRLSQKKERQATPGPEKPVGPRRPVDMERLSKMALPIDRDEVADNLRKQIEEATLLPGMLKSHSTPGLMGPSPAAGPRWAANLVPKGSNAPAQQRGADRTAAPRRNAVSEALVGGGLATLSGSPTQARRCASEVALRLPKRQAKLRPDEDMPGLERLLDRSAFRGEPYPVAGGGASAGYSQAAAVDDGFDSHHRYAPSVIARKVRSDKSQKKYIEDRLYKKPAPLPSSVEGLQQRLAALQAERKQREAAAASAAATTAQ
eukprot:TRINITY_DN1510_c0_g2_i1.p1 TRINITY_DN1510_c0_g2~~TRINITY_DN1510_c0_g2_i1.p1  ORF type:complete len:540 (+),score=139.14 TRINITY_DN1510_c0_g2_i1:96-1715(+)